jgi:hypothetical protein
MYNKDTDVLDARKDDIFLVMIQHFTRETPMGHKTKQKKMHGGNAALILLTKSL